MISLPVHPGYTRTELRTELQGRRTPLIHRLIGIFFEEISQSPSTGVLPQLYAATVPGVCEGEYYGPGGFLQSRGYPKRIRSSRRSYGRTLARRLWRVSKELTGVTYPV
jgi:hypothetical protein